MEIESENKDEKVKTMADIIKQRPLYIDIELLNSITTKTTKIHDI